MKEKIRLTLQVFIYTPEMLIYENCVTELEEYTAIMNSKF